MRREMADELTVTGGAALATMTNPPEAVLAEAKKAAAALQDVISQKPKKVMMGGEQYLEFEDWQTLARFYGITAGVEMEPEYVDLGGVTGFKATSVALFQGAVISRATAYCLSDEEKWGTRPKYAYHMALKAGGSAPEEESDKSDWVWEDNPNKPGGKKPKRVKVRAGEETVPLYQLASMAQTRANAKVMRNVLSWVAVLAGYKPTPAEEMPDTTTVEAEVMAPKREAKARGVSKAKYAAADILAQEREPGSDVACPHCQSENVGTANDGTAFCRDCRKGI